MTIEEEMNIATNVSQAYEDNLLQIFEYYCQYGDPINTSSLKSVMLLKMFKDAGLIKTLSVLPKSLKQKGFR
eukprot:CAMPEP_0116887050 /NCGR_PEP_ID=MMETSP0463-20121206/21179_1 /TAXON_ID=181622 /ORGANISM="Strombidinopsis sp, Strain SopsisLIS2011" /LENGTH=71 /DNA_ID=CAMNT_0004548641 /DNA_START=271 /DNA_END=486 /DNA_ORIENTATION=-